MQNPQYEQHLENQGVKWKYLERLDLTMIDRRKSRANQARLDEVIFEDLVGQYRMRYKAGDKFPPLVVYQVGKHYVIIDGNQRDEACQPCPKEKWHGLKTHDAYLVENSDAAILERLAGTFNNAVNGRRLTYDESLKHAVGFVRRHGYTNTRAANEFGVPMKAVERLVRLESLKDTLREQKVKKIPSDNHLDRLSSVGQLGGDVLARAATIVADTGASLEDVEHLAQDVRRAKTNSEKLSVIEKFEKSDYAMNRKAETKGGTVKFKYPRPMIRLERALKEARKVMEDYGKVRTTLVPANAKDRQTSRELAADVIRLLVDVYGVTILQMAKEE